MGMAMKLQNLQITPGKAKLWEPDPAFCPLSNTWRSNLLENLIHPDFLPINEFTEYFDNVCPIATLISELVVYICIHYECNMY